MDVWRGYNDLAGSDPEFDCFEVESEHEISMCINNAVSQGYKGLFIAAPFQHRAFQAVDQLSDEAQKTGLVDTLWIDKGIVKGYNTEYGGFMKALFETGMNLTGKKAMTAGYSASLSTVIAALKDAGIAEIIVVVKDKKRLPAKYFDCTVINEDELVECKDIGLFVNCGATGMFPDTGSCPVAYDLSGGYFECVIDLIYYPWDTALVKKARKRGKIVQNGMWTAIYQVLKAHEIWTCTKHNPDLARELFYKMKKLAGDNIVLIGMPGSGKSSVGRTLAKTLSIDFADTDEYIEAFYGQISELFDIGEEYFRGIETKALRQLSYSNGMVVSTGGGIVTQEENIPLLKNTGKVFFLDRSPELIIQSADLKNRPLLAGDDRYEKLMQLYNQRIHLYRKAADFIIDNNRGIFQAVQAIKSNL